jgi:CheY-like chemotaxis protein
VLVEEAAHLAGDEVLERLKGDPYLEEVVTRAIQVAVVTAHEQKRRLLARVVAAGLRDDALIDETLLLVRTIDAIDPPHLQVLAILNRAPNHLAVYEVKEQLPGEPDAVEVLLAQLRREGLADSFLPATLGGATSATPPLWHLTRHGRRLLEYLADAAPR